MKIPLLDLKAQYDSIKDEVNEALERVVESQYFILSQEVDELEKEVAGYCGVPHAAGVASGTDALILALRAAGVKKGDKVITTPFTFFATAESVSLLGATPLFVDIEPDTYNIDPGKIEELFKEQAAGDKKDIKAVIPVHLYGQCADMDPIMDIAGEHGLAVVEDCAQAIGAEYKGKKAGSFGTAGSFSFFPSKNLGGFGDGGMVASHDGALIEHIKKLRVHGSSKQYIHEEVAYNSRLDSIQAAVLRVKLKKLDAWLEGRRAVASRYDSAFLSANIKTPVTAEGRTHTYHQYTIAVDERDALQKYLGDKGIPVRVYYPVPLHLQPCYKELGYREGSIPVAEEMSKKILSLPIYPELSDEQIDYIIKTVKDFFK